MSVRIRLARFGKAHQPVFNIVVCNARTARGSKPFEVLGTYDPSPKAPLDGEGRQFKDMKLDFARTKYWLGVGARPSEAAWRLLTKTGLMPEKFATAESRWRANTVDELSRKVHSGEMTVKEYVQQVSQLNFFPGKIGDEPSDMPVADPFAEDEAEAARHMDKTSEVESYDDLEVQSDFDDFFTSTLKRRSNGLLDKDI